MNTRGFILQSALTLLAVLSVLLLPVTTQAARLKDLADIEGVRGNQLIGYGVVVGLQGTGDQRGAPFTSQSISNMLERFGMRVDAEQLTSVTNTASVMVTAELPPFSRPGSKLNVTLSSLGDAQSLQGGILLMTPLKGSDGKTYAVAQGPVSIGGFVIGDSTDSAQRNHPTVAHISGGATVEKHIPFDLFANGTIRIVLRSPDFKTVTRVQDAVNRALGSAQAKAIDSASVVLPLDPDQGHSPIHLIAKLEAVEVEPDLPARVVINERTGTIIMGDNVRVSRIALAHGNLNITIRGENQISQPNPLASGTTAGVQNRDLTVTEGAGQLNVIDAAVSLGDVVNALNGLGATPRDLIAIFQAMKTAGALQAELVVM